MKIKMLLLLACCITGVVSIQPVQAESPAPTQSDSQSATLDVQNMTCAMCPITVRKALQGVEGMQNAEVDFDSKTASVNFDPKKTNTEALIKATINAGYPATVRQAD